MPGNPSPDEISVRLMSEGMPFELSPERARYALLTSITDYRSLRFPVEVAEYVVPDLGFINGNYVSLFAPGVSYLAIPLYFIGKYLNLGQVFAFATSSFFALVNVYLIFDIVRKLTKNSYAGMVAGLVFLFGTSAWPYAVTLYQHHVTSSLLLLSLRILINKVNVFTSILIGSIFALSIFIEYPNAIFFIPIIILTVSKYIDVKEMGNKLVVDISTYLLAGLIGLAIFFLPFFVYNYKAHDNPLQLASTITRAEDVEIDITTGQIIPPAVGDKEKKVTNFFDLNKLPNSMSVLLTSKDRGILWFSPVILLGLLGVRSLYKKRKELALTIGAVTGTILILYGMWGDPWGGWAFGPRYLIPALALMAIFLGSAIDTYSKKFLFSIVFVASLLYSNFINLSGALTTIQIPPSVEIDAQRYPQFTFLHNFDLVLKDKSSSFVYNYILDDFIQLKYYFLLFFIFIFSVTIVAYINSAKDRKHLL